MRTRKRHAGRGSPLPHDRARQSARHIGRGRFDTDGRAASSRARAPPPPRRSADPSHRRGTGTRRTSRLRAWPRTNPAARHAGRGRPLPPPGDPARPPKGRRARRSGDQGRPSQRPYPAAGTSRSPAADQNRTSPRPYTLRVARCAPSEEGASGREWI